MIPMNQTVHIRKSSALSDGWGKKALAADWLPLRCRVDDVAETIENQSGDETIVTLKITLRGLVDVGYEDDIRYENELGHVTTAKPTKIQPLRGVSGKPLFTVVYL